GDGAEIDGVLQSIDPLRTAGKLGDVTVLRAASLLALQSALRGKSYDIVHLVTPFNSSGTSRPVTGETLGYLLGEPSLRLLVLRTHGGTDMAREVHRTGVPAVISLPGDGETRAFVDALYQVLADGCPIEVCTAEGRKAIMVEEGFDNPRWAL